MPKFNTPFWDKAGKLYRAGTEVPASALKASSGTAKSGAGGAGTPGGKGDALPDEFPAREALVGGGYNTLADVRAASDEELDGLPGVGPATIREIRDAIGGV